MTVKQCFVIGPIGERDSEVRAHADDLIKYIVAPVIKEFDYREPERADTMPDPGRITTQIVQRLKDADLIIADLTFGNPNVYYELSLRHALGLPLIHMALDGTRLPFDVIDSRTIFFTMHSRRAETAKDELKKQIRYIQTNTFKASNPIIDTLERLNLERSAEPLEQLVGVMLSKLETLSANVESLSARMSTETASNTSINDLYNRAVLSQLVNRGGFLRSPPSSIGAGTILGQASPPSSGALSGVLSDMNSGALSSGITAPSKGT